MSSAYYPQGMKTYNNHTNPGNYVSWKGTGINSNPVGTTYTNIRPLYNKDPGNVAPLSHGIPKPLKHYRKGRVIPAQPLLETSALAVNINRNTNRYVKSSRGASLGGGSGGTSLVSQMISMPGSYLVKANPSNETNEENQATIDCTNCKGFPVVTNYKPNKGYLTENPTPQTTNPKLCCNAQKKAVRRAIYASTNLKKNYFTTLQQYRQNRCMTFDQRAFNFRSSGGNNDLKPGSPEALLYNTTYVANCQPNINIIEQSLKNPSYSDPSNLSNCKLVVYKPNNFQYATQGAVSSSERTLKLNVTTIEKNLAGYNYDMRRASSVGPVLNASGQPIIPFVYKNKVQGCNAEIQRRFQNHRSCNNLPADPTQPPQSSNHYAQSPQDPLM